MTEDNLVFLCMTDASVKKIKAYKFLEAIKQKFYNTFQKDQIKNAVAYGLPFVEQIKGTMV